MAPNSNDSSSQTHKHKYKIPPKVVIVKPGRDALSISALGSPKDDKSHKGHLQVSDVEKLVNGWELLTLHNDTVIDYKFNGTGVAVVGMNHTVFPPIPNNFLPQWSCFIDGQLQDNSKPPHLNTPWGFPIPDDQNGKNGDIPADFKTRICQARSLNATEHTLKVKILVPSLPAYFHSIRYEPLEDEEFPNDTHLRIDNRDNKSLSYPNHGWKFDNGFLEYDGEKSSNLTVHFRGDKLKWYGYNHGKDWSVFLNGEEHKPLKLKGDPAPLFEVEVDSKDKKRDLGVQNNLTVFVKRGHSPSLHHVLVTIGSPTGPLPSPIMLSSMNSTNTKHSNNSVVATATIGGVSGLIVLALALYIFIRVIKRRRDRRSWKDSALPSAIGYPASKVSSRSSFSQEVVTGDLEYNPEAEKKLDALNVTAVEPPPAAVVLHADSGVRIPHVQVVAPLSEVPPRYTYI